MYLGDYKVDKFFNEFLKGIEDAVNSSNKNERNLERIIKEEKEPIKFVIPGLDKLPESVQDDLNGITKILKDVVGGKGVPRTDVRTDSVSETDVIGEQSDVTRAYVDGTSELTPFALYEGKDRFTLYVPAVGITEYDLSIRFEGDDLFVTSGGLNLVEVFEHKLIAGNSDSITSPILVILPMPDVVKEKTTFELSKGLLKIELFKVDKKPTVFVVK